MRSLRGLVVLVAVGVASFARAAPPAATTLAEASATSKDTYDRARAELVARGKKAKAAALAGDFAAWKPTNEAYTAQLTVLTGICEQIVGALTSATDIAHQETKVVIAAYSQYVDVASSMLKVRLQLTAYQNLCERFAPADRTVVVKALATQYLTGE